MLFRLLGRTVRWAWAPILVAWALLFLGTHVAAPRFEDVAEDSELAFLPAGSPSRRAEQVYRQAFPDDHYSSNIVLVVHRSRAASGHREGDLHFVEKMLEPGLWKIAQDQGGLATQAGSSEEPLFSEDDNPVAAKTKKRRSIIARIRSPGTPGAGSLLVSPDGQAMLVVLELTTEFLAEQNGPTIDRVAGLVSDLKKQGKIPDGVDITLTGSAVIGRDHIQAQLDSIRATELLTVVLVVVLLVLIYRAPLLALIPLVTVYLGVQISLNLMAIMAQAGWIILFQGIQIYVIILSYGAGVDYCLFLTARYREELDHGASPADAIAEAIGAVGAAVVASAGTVMVGIAMMMFAQFGKFQQAGFAIPFSLGIVLAATLTFSPALMRLAGHWAFWPGKPGQADAASPPPPAGVWHWLGEALLRRPGAIWVATMIALMPFVVVAGLTSDRVSYDLIGDLPSGATSVAGNRVLEEHFPPGVLGPVTVLLIDRKAISASRPARISSAASPMG